MTMVSSNEDQNAAGRALLATVVQLALSDACTAPVKRYDGRLPITTDAFTAMRFLFDTSVPGLNEYATWLDINPDRMRAKLHEMMQDTSPNTHNGFDAMQRRYMRQNYQAWRSVKTHNLTVNEDDND
jgi:hypothetical protein